MNWVVSVYTILLFFVLTPGIVVRLPPKGDKYAAAGVHALIFAVVFQFTHNLIVSLLP